VKNLQISAAIGFVLLIGGCISTSVTPLGQGQYIAIREEIGGSSTSMTTKAHLAASRQCGDDAEVRVLRVNSGARTAGGTYASVMFECTPLRHFPHVASSGAADSPAPPEQDRPATPRRGGGAERPDQPMAWNENE
jgi:hypothetical protein